MLRSYRREGALGIVVEPCDARAALCDWRFL